MMASHEIELTRSQLGRENSISGIKASRYEYPPTPSSKDYSDSDVASREKETNLDAEDNDDDGDEPSIQYRYLTFETELPQPTSITPRSPDAPLPPAPPDLKKFMSPFLWSEAQKRMIIWLSVVATAFTAFSAGAYSPGLDQMTNHWGVSNVAVLTGITTFTTGFGLAPMVLAPFSEINGRVS
jgi:hypothetical protein